MAVKEIKLTLRNQQFYLPPKKFLNLPTITKIIENRQKESICSTLNHLEDVYLLQADSKGCIEIELDRSPVMFSIVYDAIVDGHLHTPSNVCMKAVQAELNFWGVCGEMLEPCCQVGYRKMVEKEAFYQMVKKQWLYICGGYDQCLKDSTDTKTWRCQIWIFLEDARSSLMAKVGFI